MDDAALTGVARIHSAGARARVPSGVARTRRSHPRSDTKRGFAAEARQAGPRAESLRAHPRGYLEPRPLQGVHRQRAAGDPCGSGLRRVPGLSRFYFDARYARHERGDEAPRLIREHDPERALPDVADIIAGGHHDPRTKAVGFSRVGRAIAARYARFPSRASSATSFLPSTREGLRCSVEGHRTCLNEIAMTSRRTGE